MKLHFFILFLCFIFMFPCYSSTLGPQSELYMTLWQNGGLAVVKGGSIVRSWGTSANSELAIAVSDKIRTTGHSTGSTGAEYTLDGTFTGVTYSTVLLSNHDGATDGQYNYGIVWTTGNLYRYNLTWQNPEYLFNVGSDALTITYDPTNQSFWITTWGSGMVKNFSKTGTLLSSFSTPRTAYNAALAMDYADGTLWMSEDASSTLSQYTRTGTYLGSITYSSLSGAVWGAEFAFAVPEPYCCFLLLAGMICFFFFKR